MIELQMISFDSSALSTSKQAAPVSVKNCLSAACFDVDNADESKQAALRQFLTDTGAEEVNVKSI